MDEELLVRLTGEASDYIKMLSDAQSKTESVGSSISSALDGTSSQAISSLDDIAQTVNQYSEQIEVASEGIDELTDAQDDASDSTESLADKLDSAASALGDISKVSGDVAEAISKVTGGLEFWDSFNAFAEAEASEIKLRAALEANGREVETLIGNYKDFADEIQNVSTTEGDLAIALLQQAESLGVTGEAAKRAVKNAIAMQNAFGVAAESAVRMTTELENGQTTMLARYIPALRGVKDGAEAAALAQEYLAKAHKVTEANAQTAAGQIEQLNNAWGDFKEEVGGIIAQVLKPLVSTLKEVVTFFQELPQPVKIAVAGLLTLVTVIGAVSAVSATVIVAVKGVIGVLTAYITITKLATVATIALKGILIAGVAYAAYEAGKALSGVNEAVSDLNQAMNESQRLNDMWAERFEKSTSSIMKDIEKVTDPIEKQSAISKQLKTAEKDLQTYKELVESSEEAFDELNTRWNRWTATSVVESANKELEDHRRKLELARNRVDQLNNAYQAIRPIEFDEKLIDRINKFNDKLKEQREHFGMSAEELELYKLKLDGATHGMLAASRAALQLNLAIKASNSIVGEFKSLLDNLKGRRLELEFDMRGATEVERNVSKLDNKLQDLNRTLDQLKLEDKLSFDPLTGKDIDTDTIKSKISEVEAKLNEVKGLQVFGAMDLQKVKNLTNELGKWKERLSVRDQIQEITKAIEEVSRQKFDIQIEAKNIDVLKRVNDLIKEGKDITKKFMTPFEKYQDELNSLKVLLSTGTISLETYNRALEDANQRLQNLERSAMKARQEILRFNHVEFGSGEAQDRIEEFNETLKHQIEQFKKIAEERKKVTTPVPSLVPRNVQEIEDDARRKLGQFNLEMQDKGNLRPLSVPSILPKGATPEIPRAMSAVSPSDMTAVSDRREMIKFLSSIDTSLKSISNKSGVNLTNTNIRNT